MMMIKYAVVDDKPLNRKMPYDKLNAFDDFEMVLEASNGEEFLEEIKKLTDKPDLVFMDIDMPELNGIKTVSIASELYPEIKFIMLTVFDDNEKIFDAIQAGALGYLLKDDSYKHIEQYAREAIHFGGAPMSPRIARKTLQLLANNKTNNKPDESVLSERETEILKNMVEGKDYKEIAEIMFISPFTVRTHIHNIYKKLHVNNKTQAVKIALKKGWFNF